MWWCLFGAATIGWIHPLRPERCGDWTESQPEPLKRDSRPRQRPPNKRSAPFWSINKICISQEDFYNLYFFEFRSCPLRTLHELCHHELPSVFMLTLLVFVPTTYYCCLWALDGMSAKRRLCVSSVHWHLLNGSSQGGTKRGVTAGARALHTQMFSQLKSSGSKIWNDPPDISFLWISTRVWRM